MKMMKPWTGKKDPTNQAKKEQHKQRKSFVIKKHEIESSEQQQAILEYKKNANQSI
jgi:hypothetical protein